MLADDFIESFIRKFAAEKEKTIKEAFFNAPDISEIIKIFYYVRETPTRFINEHILLSSYFKIGLVRRPKEEILKNFINYFSNMPS